MAVDTEWLRKSVKKSGVPLKVQDPAVQAAVVTLVRAVNAAT